MHRLTTPRVQRVVPCLIAIGLMACQPGEPASSLTTEVPDYRPTATIRELMHSVIDPSADIVWLSVGTVMDREGTHEIRPRTDEEWAQVRRAALMLLESANLLMIPGRSVAHSGERSFAPGIELEPEQIAELISEGPESWNARAVVLHEVMTSIIAGIDARDAETVFMLGSQLQGVCESCHRQYWYPGEVIPSSRPY